jgi:hypothetical protein
MFGHDSLPSIVYEYGAREPIENAQQVSDQMHLAHKYRHRLVRLELDRRAREDELASRLAPALVDLKHQIGIQLKKKDDAEEEIKKARILARKKVRPAGHVVAIREAKAALKVLEPQYNAERARLRALPAWIAEHEVIEAWYGQQRKEYYASSGIYWGTRLLVGNSVTKSDYGDPPRFHPWRGDGHLAIQIQGGLPTDKLFSLDTQIQVEPVPEEAWEPGGRHLRKTLVKFRIGSDAKTKPVWAVVPIVLHRRLPEATVKWVHLIRRKIAAKCEWRVQFVLSKKTAWVKPDVARTGEVGIDVGWRMMPAEGPFHKKYRFSPGDRDIRVARWIGDDRVWGELRLPADWVKQRERVRRIQSHRDDHFNKALEAVAVWLQSQEKPPAWAGEEVRTIRQWESKGRLVALVMRWGRNRVAGDEAAYEVAEAWRKRERHLYEYERNLEDQLLRRREYIYRDFAAKLRRKYRTAYIEDLDLRKFHKKDAIEDPVTDEALREHTRDACLSKLFSAIKQSMAETIERNPRNTTRFHCDCGSIEDWDRKKLMHTCSVCGRTYDQDDNAAMNLLLGNPASEKVAQA